MNYDLFISRFVEKQKLVGVDVQVSKTYSNVGQLNLCLPGKFSPFLAVCFYFDTGFSTLAYFKPGPRCQYGTGHGCMPVGAIRQETFKQHEADTAFENLLKYSALAKDNDFDGIPRRGVYLGWNSATESENAAPCR